MPRQKCGTVCFNTTYRASNRQLPYTPAPKAAVVNMVIRQAHSHIGPRNDQAVSNTYLHVFIIIISRVIISNGCMERLRHTCGLVGYIFCLQGSVSAYYCHTRPYVLNIKEDGITPTSAYTFNI